MEGRWQGVLAPVDGWLVLFTGLTPSLRPGLLGIRYWVEEVLLVPLHCLGAAQAWWRFIKLFMVLREIFCSCSCNTRVQGYPLKMLSKRFGRGESNSLLITLINCGTHCHWISQMHEGKKELY